MALEKAHHELVPLSDTPLLDAEVLLADVLQVSRSYLFAFPERELTNDEMHSFKKWIEQRKQNMPVAYITGHKEFWSLDLKVTENTLIPRPETERLVECVLQEISGPNKRILDLGTGSGAIALALAHERPSWEIYATDISIDALKIATLNAKRLHLSQVVFYHGDWFDAFSSRELFDAIVSNPPYIAPDDPDLEKRTVDHEPKSALFADEKGLKEARHIIMFAKDYLKPSGMLFLEHGFKQAREMRNIFLKMGYSNINTVQDLAGLDRVTSGRI